MLACEPSRGARGLHCPASPRLITRSRATGVVQGLSSSVQPHALRCAPSVPSMKDSLSSRRVQILVRRSLLHHPRRRRRRSICPRARSMPPQRKNAPSAHHPLSPRWREITSVPPGQSSSWADVACTLNHLSELVRFKRTAHITTFERRPIHPDGGSGLSLAAMARSEVVFVGRHVHLDRLNNLPS